MLHTKYQDSRYCGFKQEHIIIFILKICFSPCDLDMQQTKIILTIIDQGHIRTILANFGKNPASSLGEDVL